MICAGVLGYGIHLRHSSIALQHACCLQNIPVSPMALCQIRKGIFDRHQLRHRFIPSEHSVDGCDRFGTGDLTFRVEQPIGTALTRAQAAAMIGRTQSKGYALADLTFSDSAKIPAYAAYYIRAMVGQGVISGYSDGSFKPHRNITRGQMAKILYNLM